MSLELLYNLKKAFTKPIIKIHNFLLISAYIKKMSFSLIFIIHEIKTVILNEHLITVPATLFS